jgi:hypothetical protein
MHTLPLWAPPRNRIQEINPMDLEIDEITMIASVSMEHHLQLKNIPLLMRHQTIQPQVGSPFVFDFKRKVFKQKIFLVIFLLLLLLF